LRAPAGSRRDFSFLRFSLSFLQGAATACGSLGKRASTTLINKDGQKRITTTNDNNDDADTDRASEVIVICHRDFALQSHHTLLAEIKGRSVDALAGDADEGRGVAAISFGEVLSNL